MVNSDGSIVRRAKINDVEFRVIYTSKGESQSVWGAIDCIRNERSKNDRIETRAKWREIFKDKKWTPILEE